MQTYLNHWIENIINALPNFVSAVLIFFASLYLAGFLSGLLLKVLAKKHAAAGVTSLLTQLTRWSVILIGTVTALQRFFDVTAFLTGLGILGFTVGFALQDVMKNFAAGVILLLQEPFKTGEDISVAGFEGTVRTIDLRTFEMITFDGRIVILPNAEALSHAIINYTRANRRRVDLPLGISASADAQLARSLALQAIQDVDGFVNEPAPVLYLNSLTGDASDSTAWFWIDSARTNPLRARDAALSAIQTSFAQRGVQISIPASRVYMQAAPLS